MKANRFTYECEKCGAQFEFAFHYKESREEARRRCEEHEKSCPGRAEATK